MKKIGLLILALVLALGTVGVGYAMWSDTVYIDGTVSTGCVDIEITSVSGTWVYKNIDTGAIVYSATEITDLDLDDLVGDETPNELMLVAKAVAEEVDNYAEEDEEIFITLDNIFPTIDWDETALEWVDHPLIADVLFTYPCEVPAHVIWDVFTGAECLDLECLVFNWTVKDAAGAVVYTGTDVGSIQLHLNYTLYLEVYFNASCLQYTPGTQNLSCSFYSNFIVHQWNEDFID
jgi:hypothetical protein